MTYNEAVKYAISASRKNKDREWAVFSDVIGDKPSTKDFGYGWADDPFFQNCNLEDVFLNGDRA